MGGGRKNLKRAVEQDNLTLQQGQSIMQVVSLRGSNLIEVMDARGEKSLALFPAKFQKSMWIKRGSFVVVDESGREKALESGCKVACIVSQVLFYEQVCRLQKCPDWPEAFKSQTTGSSTKNMGGPDAVGEEEEEVTGTSDDDGLPPLETNMNRRKHIELCLGAESNSDTDADSEDS